MADHYFSEKPESKKVTKEIQGLIKNISFTFKTSSGVFGKSKIDKGTLLLIENAKVKPKSTILDLGCGYGVIGVALKRLYPEVIVLSTDVNERAVELTKTNAQKNKVEIKSRQSDLFKKIPETFDVILCNLPQHAGKKICFEIIQESKEHLNPGGSLQVVSRHQKGGKEYEKKMMEVFGNCDYLAKGSGFRVYRSLV